MPVVLIEALACGTAVLSTDCPHGPQEILEGGRYGRLVAVGDVDGLAAAVAATLAEAPDREQAGEFSVEWSGAPPPTSMPWGWGSFG
jgi:glycosyltransferase involved in cell wall biosynthesis